MRKQLLLLVMLLIPMVASAYDFEKDGIYYNITSLQELTVEVTSGDNRYEGIITIPETVDYSERTFHVIRIGEKAFLSSGITGVELPHSILTVGEYAFRYCYQLSSITIPSSITSFEHGAFGGCSNLNNVVIEDAETQLSLPWNEWQVNNSSYFNNCNLTSVYYGRNVSYRQGNVYDGLFWNQNNLRNVVIGPFVTILDGDLFKKCQGLETIDIPANVKTIGRSTFEDCSSLKNVIFHEGLQEILGIAFKNCKTIDKLILPNTLTSIGTEAFVGCTGITKVYSKITEPFDIAESTFAGIAYLNSVLYVPIGTKSLYQERTGWKDFASIVETDDFDVTPDIPVKPQCATPTIAFKEGKFVFNCETEGVTYIYSFKSTSSNMGDGNNVSLPSTYTVTVYAKKDGYLNSETVTKEIDVRGLMGDMNEDGSLSVTDVTILIDKILKQK
ncbi:MAG: leucine-rich repeat domain-containing protein [Bacteroidaceae bacterium]|nr:leucine-rich repeat domain-containing protein [Bacteroidaceae bacterium]